MRKFLLIGCLLMALMLLIPGVALASYDYYIPIEVYNNDSEALTGIPVLITLNNSQLAALGYINSSGLDTDLQEGSTSRAYLVADSRLGFLVPSIEGYQTRTFNYRLGESPEQGNFSAVLGDGGYFDVTDHADLELGNNFSIEFDGWIDTSNAVYLYPTVETSSASMEPSAETSHTVSLPSGIEAGNLLLMLFGGRYINVVTITWPSGWTGLGQAKSNYGIAGAAYRIADGTEGSTAIATTSDTCYSAHQTFRIVDYFGVPEISSWANGGSANPNSPSLSPSWGSKETLWFSFFGGSDADSVTMSSPPTNYGDEGLSKSTAPTAYAGSATREIEAASEDPGAFTLSGGIQWFASTIAIQGFSGQRIVSKETAFYIYTTTEEDIEAYIGGGSPKTVTATGIESGEHTVEVWADGTNFGIDIDGVTKDSVALAGASVPNTLSDWVVTVPCFDYYEHLVDGSLEAWFLPITMVQTTVLPDRSGGGRHGTITWGSNPGSIEVSIGGLQPYSAYVAPGAEDDEIPQVLPTPGTISPDATAGVTGEGLPMQAGFQRAANSLEWTLPVTYSVMFIIVALVVGVAGFAIGSTWGFTIGFGSTAAFFGAIRDSSGYLVMPIWITIIVVMLALFIGFVWRTT